MPTKRKLVLEPLDLLTGPSLNNRRSHIDAIELFSDPNSKNQIIKKVEDFLGCKIDQENIKTLIDPKSINGKGGHLVITTKNEKAVLTDGFGKVEADIADQSISGDGGDRKKSDEKKYHLKLVLKNDGISLEHQFAEIAYYLMYHNFGYGPKTAVLMHNDSLILLLEDANNPLPNGMTVNSFSDWKKIKDTVHQSEIEKKLTNSKADLYAVEILTLILATGDIFQKPDNYGVRIANSQGCEKALPFVVDLLPPPHNAHLTFFGKIGASRYCENFDNPQKYAKLIADLLLKSFDPKGDQREVMKIKDFHVFEFFKEGIRGLNIEDLKGGLQIILNNKFYEKINQAFDNSLKYLDDYCLASETKISEEHKNQRKIIEERRNFILSVVRELREHPEIKDVMSGKWYPGKNPQTGRSVDAVDREKPRGAGDEYFPSPPQLPRVAEPKVVDDSLKPTDPLLGKRSFSALACGLVSELESKRLRPVSASPLQEEKEVQSPSPR